MSLPLLRSEWSVIRFLLECFQLPQTCMLESRTLSSEYDGECCLKKLFSSSCQVVIQGSDDIASRAIDLLKEIYTNLGPKLQVNQVLHCSVSVRPHLSGLFIISLSWNFCFM